MRLGRDLGGLARGAAVVLTGTLVGLSVPAAATGAVGPVGSVTTPVGGSCLDVDITASDQMKVKGDNTANLSLHVAQAQALATKAGKQPGQGVTVVVVDTPLGAYPAPAEVPSGHGYAVAGIVNGADQDAPDVSVGIAPGATVRPADFYDVPERTQDGQRTPTAAALATTLSGLADQRAGGLGGLGGKVVVVVPAQVPYSAELEAAASRLVDSGVLLVAASGDRPADEGGFPDGYEGNPKKGEDVADLVWPAALPGVVAVGVSAPDSGGTVLRSSAIDLSAPGVDAVSRARNGGWCVVGPPSTAWAAAEVAGVAALVWSMHPDEDATQLRTRLEQTASGNGGPSSPLTGYGVVQPVEAIQRDVAEMGAEKKDQVEPARPPRARADVLAGARHDAVWWGLGGGAALVVLLILRPLLSRRR